jgi:hypothetical protein
MDEALIRSGHPAGSINTVLPISKPYPRHYYDRATPTHFKERLKYRKERYYFVKVKEKLKLLL